MGFNGAAASWCTVVLMLARGSVGTANTCDDGVLFVPHTNPHFDVPKIQATLGAMLGVRGQTGRLLDSVDAAVNPTFTSSGGIRSRQTNWDCIQDSNAGLFYWPGGDINTVDPYHYNHNRSAMLAHAATGVVGCKSQLLVLHPEFKQIFGATSLFDVPEYVREGIRLWVRAETVVRICATCNSHARVLVCACMIYVCANQRVCACVGLARR
jgi:hypothetical protein